MTEEKKDIPFLCKIGLHSYEDKISFDHLKVKGMEVPFRARTVCKYCNKVKHEVTGHVTVK